MLHCRLYIVVYSVENGSLFDDKDAEVFKEDGKWVNGIRKLVDLFTPMWLHDDLEVFFLFQNLWLVDRWLNLRWRFIAMEFLDLEAVLFLDSAQLKSCVLELCRQYRLHILPDYHLNKNTGHLSLFSTYFVRWLSLKSQHGSILWVSYRFLWSKWWSDDSVLLS